MFKRPPIPKDRKPSGLHTENLQDISSDKNKECQGFKSRSDEVCGTLKRRKTKNPGRPRQTSVGQTTKQYIKPMTPIRIQNISDYYVAQREASCGMLRGMLHKRAYKWLSQLDEIERAEKEAEFERAVEAQIQSYVVAGIIDDKRFAEMKVRSWRSAGRGSRRIQMDLRTRGIDPATAQDAIQAVDEEIFEDSSLDHDNIAKEGDWQAAEVLAQNKRIGPYRTKPAATSREERTKQWRREASVLSRAGFGLDIIRQILNQEPVDHDDFR